MKNLDIIALKYGTDKSSMGHHYTQYYQNHFSCYENKPIKLLEIGIQKGLSLLMWKDFFENAQVNGIDIHLPGEINSDRVHMFEGRQEDEIFLKELNGSSGPFDIIIDDGSHNNNDMKKSFDVLFPLLSPGGCYVIEDLHCCYWDKTHHTGPDKFTDHLKTLVDDIMGRGKTGWADRKKEDPKHENEYGKFTEYERMLKSIHLYRGICFIFKMEM